MRQHKGMNFTKKTLTFRKVSSLTAFGKAVNCDDTHSMLGQKARNSAEFESCIRTWRPVISGHF